MPLTPQASGGRPIRKDEIELHDRGHLHRVLAARTAVAPEAAPVRPRRARRVVGLGALPRLLRVARLGGPRGQPAQPLLVADRRSHDAHDRHVRRGCARRAATGSAIDGPGRPRHGRPARAQGGREDAAGRARADQPRAAARAAGAGPAPRAARGRRRLRQGAPGLGHPARNASSATTATCRSRTSGGSSTCSARSRTSRARPAGRSSSASPVERSAFAGLPILVIGGGLDRIVPEPGSERLADWLGAAYEPFGAHSHFGLVVGEHSHVQVADAIRAFLDTNHL